MSRVASGWLESRVAHQESFVVTGDLAADSDDGTGFEGLRDKTLIEPDETQSSARILDHRFGEEHLFLPGTLGFDADNRAEDGAFFVGMERVNRMDGRIVFIAMREMSEHIGDRQNPQSLQFAEAEFLDGGNMRERGIVGEHNFEKVGWPAGGFISSIPPLKTKSSRSVRCTAGAIFSLSEVFYSGVM